MDLPYPFPDLDVRVYPVPDTDDIFVLPDTDSTTAYFWPIPVEVRASSLFRQSYAVKLVANDGKHEIFPDAVCDTFLEPYDPLATSNVKWIFPYGTLDAGMEEHVVGRGLESGGGSQMCPECPERFHLNNAVQQGMRMKGAKRRVQN
jgi:hypothetical protein